jgi:hypothetical protein
VLLNTKRELNAVPFCCPGRSDQSASFGCACRNPKGQKKLASGYNLLLLFNQGTTRTEYDLDAYMMAAIVVLAHAHIRHAHVFGPMSTGSHWAHFGRVHPFFRVHSFCSSDF